MSERKPFWLWQLWKDALAILATAAIVLYSLNNFLHTFDAATITLLVQKYQIIGVIVFWISVGIAALCRWLYLRCVRRHPPAEPPSKAQESDEVSSSPKHERAKIIGIVALFALLLAIALRRKKPK